jgi:predicted nucleic acid-binding protein
LIAHGRLEQIPHLARVAELFVARGVQVFADGQHGVRRFRHAANPREGMTPAEAQAALNQFEADLANGVTVLAPGNFQDVFRRAEELSKRHTMAGGHRSFDVLHVARALHLGARDFLTFDANQRKLAAAEKMKVKP